MYLSQFVKSILLFLASLPVSRFVSLRFKAHSAQMCSLRDLINKSWQSQPFRLQRFALRVSLGKGLPIHCLEWSAAPPTLTWRPGPIISIWIVKMEDKSFRFFVPSVLFESNRSIGRVCRDLWQRRRRSKVLHRGSCILASLLWCPSGEVLEPMALLLARARWARCQPLLGRSSSTSHLSACSSPSWYLQAWLRAPCLGSCHRSMRFGWPILV